LFEVIVNQLPDTKVRDRLIEISKLPKSATIETVSKLGNDGYVVNSVPFAIYSATRVLEIGMSEMLEKIIQSGGDTDTNASIAGQIAGTLLGIDNIPKTLIDKVKLMYQSGGKSLAFRRRL
jgi:ADP-ribosylglycohydrolase